MTSEPEKSQERKNITRSNEESMWLDFVHNPKAIAHLYREVPSLEAVEVLDIHLDRGGPTLHVSLNMARFADNCPARWEPESNTVQVQLDFIEFNELKIDGFTKSPILDFSIKGLPGQITVEAKGHNMKIHFICHTIYIQKVTGYINTERTSTAMS